MLNPTAAFSVNTIADRVFNTWLALLTNFHHLTDKEIDVAALFLKTYFKNQKSIINDDVLNDVTLSLENKRKIREELKLTPTYFQIIIKSLKDKGFIKNGKINPLYIPTFSKSGSIVIAFIIKTNDNQELS